MNQIYFDAKAKCVNIHQIRCSFYIYGYDIDYLITDRGFRLMLMDGSRLINREFDWFELNQVGMRQKDFLASIICRMVEILKENEDGN